MTIKPTRTNIAVSIDKELVKTKSGIIISNEANEEAPTRGKVIAIGDSKDISKNIKIGTTVVFPP